MFQALIIRIKNYFTPKPILLGRWCSTVLNDNDKKMWFHDTGAYDNCYLKVQYQKDKKD